MLFVKYIFIKEKKKKRVNNLKGRKVYKLEELLMNYIFALFLGVTGFFHPCFIGTMATFYATLHLVKDKMKFIVGSFIGALLINLGFMLFLDGISYIVNTIYFNYFVGITFIFFGLMLCGVIKHKHSHKLLSIEKIKNTNSITVGMIVVFSWIQSFIHIFIPLSPTLTKVAFSERLVIIFMYTIGLVIPVIGFKLLTQKFKFKKIKFTGKLIGYLFIILGVAMLFNLFEVLESLDLFSLFEHGHEHHHH